MAKEQKRKIEKIWNQNGNSVQDIGRLNRDTIRINRNSFSKGIIQIQLFDGLIDIDDGSAIPCWVAAAIFGSWTQRETQMARYWIIHYAPRWFYNGYIAYGKNVAKFIKKHYIFKLFLTPMFWCMFKIGSIHYTKDMKK